MQKMKISVPRTAAARRRKAGALQRIDCKEKGSSIQSPLVKNLPHGSAALLRCPPQQQKTRNKIRRFWMAQPGKTPRRSQIAKARSKFFLLSAKTAIDSTAIFHMTPAKSIGEPLLFDVKQKCGRRDSPTALSLSHFIDAY